MPPLVTYEEIDTIDPVELRFRQACQFYAYFRSHEGQGVNPVENRFLWMCYADAFLMSLVSLKDLVSENKRKKLLAEELFRMITALRNITVHEAVVSHRHPASAVSTDFTFNVGAGPHDNAVLSADQLAKGLDHYEAELKVKGKEKAEKKNVEGARRWNATLEAQESPRIELWKVFLESLQLVADTCGFVIPLDLKR